MPAATLKLKLTPQERHASLMLALLFSVRMLGLFLLTPVFAVAALSVPGGDNSTKVGLALGAYGLTQALLQIPLGLASDRYGRRRVVLAGMLLFVVGGLVCALANRIEWIIVGRILQGLGAVSAAITAWVADATRPQVRTRAMAMVGGSIGLSFAASLVLAPVITGHFGLAGLFWTMTALGVVCMGIAAWGVPVMPPASVADPGTEPAGKVPARMRDVLRHTDLLRLNLGVFCLHFILMALFMVVPKLLVQHGGYGPAQLWQIYLPVILLSFALMAPLIFLTETRHRHRQTLQGSIIGLVVVLAMMAFAGTGGGLALMVCLTAFFVAFNILEALQPSLVSRLAPPAYKGMALGLYNTAQALGVFLGASAAGVLTASGQHARTVFALLASLALLWALANQGLGRPQQAPRTL